MERSLNRRDFLRSSIQAVAGIAAGTTAAGRLTAAPPEKKPLFRISLAQWSFHHALFQKKLDNLEFAKEARDLGIDAVEYVNQFFFDKARDEKYLAEMEKRAADNNVKSLLIMVDREGALGDGDEKKRREAVENHYKWVEAARRLGCHSVRVNARSSGSYEEQLGRAADGLRRLTEFAAKREINVLVENHGGLSSNGKWLAAVIEKVDHDRCGTLPDFGNFRISEDKWYDRYQGVRELMPFAKAVSAKSRDFDEDGNETHTDYFKMMKIVLDAGYHGWVGIEYGGGSLSERDGISATKKLLERVRKKLSRRA